VLLGAFCGGVAYLAVITEALRGFAAEDELGCVSADQAVKINLRRVETRSGDGEGNGGAIYFGILNGLRLVGGAIFRAERAGERGAIELQVEHERNCGGADADGHLAGPVAGEVGS